MAKKITTDKGPTKTGGYGIAISVVDIPPKTPRSKRLDQERNLTVIEDKAKQKKGS